VLALLEAGELSLCTLAMIESILNEENVASILERIRGASLREIQDVVNEYRPPVALRDRLRPVRVAMGAPVEIDQLLFERECAQGVPAEWRQEARIEEKLFVQFLADEALVAKFEQAKMLLCGRNSDLSFADVLDVLVTEFLDRRSPVARKQRRDAKKRDKQVHTPTSGSRASARVAAGNKKDQHVHTPSSGSKTTRHIPAAVRDDVFARDGGQCTFVAPDGTRCQARRGLEIDHIVPLAVDGTHDPDNLRLLCAAHNLRAAERTLGAHVMAPFWPRQ
jgi:5-methylcytosine-specific restriction endonuclease McrA